MELRGLALLVALGLLCGARDVPLAAVHGGATAREPVRVFFDHDGGVDDFVSLQLIASASPHDVQLVGVYVTPGDTIMRYAVPATRAVLGLFNHAHVVAGAPSSSNLAAPQEYGDDESSPNAFPEDFRLDGKRLWEKTRVGDLPTHKWAPVDTNASYVVNVLMAQPGRVVYLVTGPLTSLAAALRQNPAVADKIERVVWMGGAVDALGNVEELSPHAEWNVYADPQSARRVWELPLSIPIWMMPLDATNAVPLSSEFLHRLHESCGASFLSLAYHSTAQKTQYYLWDVATVAWLLRPSLVLEARHINCNIDATTGVTYRATKPDGRMAVVAMRLNATQLYDWMETLCKQEHKP